MLQKLITKTAIYLIKRSSLSLESKSEIITALLDRIGALPIRDIMTFDLDGTIIINGTKVDMERAVLLKNGAKVLQDNFTRKIIRDQMKYNALMIGLVGSNLEQIIFAKAANWVLLQEEELLQKLSEH